MDSTAGRDDMVGERSGSPTGHHGVYADPTHQFRRLRRLSISMTSHGSTAKVAIKVIRTRLAGPARASSRFPETEAHRIQTRTSACLCGSYAAGTTDAGQPFISMMFCPNNDGGNAASRALERR